jgi:hypothetical protein
LSFRGIGCRGLAAWHCLTLLWFCGALLSTRMGALPLLRFLGRRSARFVGVLLVFLLVHRVT